MSEQTIELYNKQTPKGEYFEELVYDGDTLYRSNYRYYHTSNISETARCLCANSNFLLDKVASGRVSLSNQQSGEHADLWTKTNEVEIYSRHKVSIIHE